MTHSCRSEEKHFIIKILYFLLLFILLSYNQTCLGEEERAQRADAGDMSNFNKNEKQKNAYVYNEGGGEKQNIQVSIKEGNFDRNEKEEKTRHNNNNNNSVKGGIIKGYINANEAILKNCKVVLNGGLYSTIVNSSGYFELYNIGIDMYILEVYHPTISFKTITLDVYTSIKNPSKVNVSVVTNNNNMAVGGGGGGVSQNPLNNNNNNNNNIYASNDVMLKVDMYTYLNFFEVKDEFNIFSLLRNPMVLVGLLCLLLMLCMPKMQNALLEEENNNGGGGEREGERSERGERERITSSNNNNNVYNDSINYNNTMRTAEDIKRINSNSLNRSVNSMKNNNNINDSNHMYTNGNVNSSISGGGINQRNIRTNNINSNVNRHNAKKNAHTEPSSSRR